jgi:hypothetical protein
MGLSRVEFVRMKVVVHGQRLRQRGDAFSP